MVKRFISGWWRYALGSMVVVLFVLPLYWMVITSLRQPGLAPPRTVEWWPADACWENFLEIFHLVPMARYSANSLIVVLVAVPITLLVASWAGFAMSQFSSRSQRFWSSFCVILLMIPGAFVWIFRYQIFRRLGIIDSLWTLIAPAFAGTSALFVMLFYWTYRRIPVQVFEAARLDGAGVWRLWSKLAWPLGRPTTIAVAVLAAVMYWSDFTGPILYIFRPKLYTLPVGLEILKQMDATNWPLLMAAACVMTIPVVIIFFFLQPVFTGELSITDLLDSY
ncbi:MAG: carbohydrate ABC transporter permease [Anaerolineales bacterium]|nr:carbohydrate ABC transporter permease [Anaerolineales bacterium]